MEPQQENNVSKGSGNPDPNQQSSFPQPPQQSPQPVATPHEGYPSAQPYAPAVTPSVAEQPPYYPQTPKKSKTGLIIGVIVAVVVAVIAIITVFALGSSSGADIGDGGDINRQQALGAEENKDAAQDANAITASYVTELDIVCEGGSVANAAQFAASEKPYKVTAFSYNEASPYKNWSSETLSSRTVPSSDTEEVSEISVVACAKEKKGTATKSTTCSFESSGENVNIDYYALKYEIEFKEAKTGKSLGKGMDVNGPAVRCPMFASYDKSNPRLYASPDDAALEEVVRTFVQ